MQIIRSVVSIWTWFEIAAVAIVGFILQAVLALVTVPFDRQRYVSGRFFRVMGVTATKLAPTWHFSIHGAYPSSLKGQRVVVVSNHASHADCFLIAQLPWEMKWLGKASLFTIPFLGWCMRLSGDIPMVRGKRNSVVEALGRCADYVKEGVPVCIFPEGTRSKTHEMLPFKNGAFRLAIETGASILPIAVAGTRSALPKHSWIFGRSRALVTVGDPISTQGMTLDDVSKLRDTTRARIEALRDQIAPLSSDASDFAAAQRERQDTPRTSSYAQSA